MASRLIIDGNAVYELDEDCERRREGCERKVTYQSVTDDGMQERKQKNEGTV